MSVKAERKVDVVAPVRLMIVEDHRMVAESLERALRSDKTIVVVALAESVAEAIAAVDAAAPNVVLMDYSLPDGTGADAAAAIRSMAPAVTIVFISGNPTDEAMLAAVEVGASGFLHKTQAIGELTDAILRAAAGEMLIPARELSRLLVSRQQARRSDAERDQVAGRLTAREREILSLMASGWDNSAMADKLHLELTTIRWHVQNILEKLGAHSKLAAVARAAEYGLVQH
ncbi:MAG TPA: response regulator transcription factor [Candidatus Solibacter sp.]|jgi:DNA-binding NarL/FixJ family response regulator|nr:response regulator transcription factor [Candidatus Solibacter sp.]